MMYSSFMGFLNRFN